MPPPTELGSTAPMENVTGQSFQATILQLLSNQQALMCRMAEQMENIQENVQSTSRNELVLDSLASNITEFAYDLQQGNTFDGWFSRYVDLFEKDASKLDDAAKNHKCRDCGQTGHKEGYCSCFTSKTNFKRFTPKQQNHATKIVTVNNVKRSRRFVETVINGVPVELQLDSGSDMTIISKQNWFKIGAPQTSLPDCKVQTASGDRLQIEA
uniref:Peptidase A2 domain-containing protein n=1 Tax=Anopheles epiroticus TaxID=199890 RepID=A0A182PWS6_9DIPT